MPKVFSWNCYRFHFFANEGDPREPPHVHVTKDKDTAKCSGYGPRFSSPTTAGLRPACFHS